jgi:general secretion pathway protein G
MLLKFAGLLRKLNVQLNKGDSMKKIGLFLVVCLVALIIYAMSKPSNQEVGMMILTDNQVKAIAAYLLEYKELHGSFPKKEDWFKSLNEITSVNDHLSLRIPLSPSGEALDPWGNPYHYEYPGEINSNFFDLWSNGADGEVGGVNINEDVGNW